MGFEIFIMVPIWVLVHPRFGELTLKSLKLIGQILLSCTQPQKKKLKKNVDLCSLKTSKISNKAKSGYLGFYSLGN
jgi:hypothetical protein